MPIASSSNRSPRLPAPSTPLLGRTTELETARRLLLDDDARLVTLTGPAGVGKTRLALALMTDAAVTTAFEDGAFFVDLAPLRDPTLVPAALAQTLGVHGVVEEWRLTDLLVDHLRRRRMLIVLDNVEQVRSAAPLVDLLVAACPGLAIVVTSREPLRLRREHLLPVPPLALPDPGRLAPLAELEQIPAVALFVRRARAVDPEFAVTPATAPAVAALCVRLDGLPLAIELAAPYSRVLAPAALLVRLEHHLAALSWSAADLPPRQQTLRAAIGWSYDLLGTAEQAFYRRLGTFVDGFTCEAAEAVTDADALGVNALDTVTALVNQSLVQVVPTEEGEARDTVALGPRFRLLETIREYALERLVATEELAATRARHAAFYLDLAEHAAVLLLQPDGSRWLDRLERELDNLRAALRWHLATERSDLRDDRAGSEAALRLAAALWYFWWVRGHLDEGRGWLAQALAGATNATPALRANGLAAAGQLAQWQGDHDPATGLLGEALVLFRAVGDARGSAFVLTNLGVVAWRRGDNDRGAALHEAALILGREADDPWLIALVLLHLGLVARLQGEERRAVDLLEEAVDRFRVVGEAHLALALASLAEVVGQRSDPARAAHLLGEALVRAGEQGNRSAVAFVTALVAGTVAAWGEPTRVARLLGAADGLAHGTGWRRTPFEEAAYDRADTVARGVLDAAAFAAAYAAGRALSSEAVVVEAMAAVAAPPAAPEATPAVEPAAGNPLSPRQREVLQLVAEGRSNREIGRALAITERTATFHVTSILNKLGADTRAQAVGLAARRGLL